MIVLPLVVLAGYALAAVTPSLVELNRRYSVVVLAALPLAIAALLLSLAPDVLEGGTVRFSMAWVPSLGLDLTFALDGLSLLFALLISGIGALVIVYGHRYLADDGFLGRFHAMLLAFMASMLGLVLADSLLLLVVFWGLTGITSFLLIGFDHTIGTSRISATQALIVTVAGELAMLAGIVLLGLVAGTFVMSDLPGAGEAVRGDPRYGLMTLLILAGAMAKSAQFPFHFWLPNAMAAPGPVSAYLHSATMVTAGVYLLARLTPTLGGSELWTSALILLGGTTMLIGAFLSLRQHDLKLVLAYTTVGALGTMVLLVGIGTEVSMVAAMAVLLAHALYKATLFLVTGIVDHETGTRQLGKLGGLRRVMPITAFAAALAALSMAGLPPLIGFAGKELTKKAALDAPDVGLLLTAAVVLAGVTTVTVAAIVAIVPFHGRPRLPREDIHEPSWQLWLGPLTLGLTGLIVGLVPSATAGPLVSAAAESALGSVTKTEVLPWYGLDPALLLSIAGIVAGVLLFARREAVRAIVRRLDQGHRFGPEKAYVMLERDLVPGAKRITSFTQNGHLRLYLLTVVSTTFVLVWGVLIIASGVPALTFSGDLFPWELAIAVTIVGGALAAVASRSRLGAVTSLGIVGYGIALVYLLFGAPDLAMAQILIETLTVMLFVVVFYHMPAFGRTAKRASRWRDGAIATSGGLLVTTFVLVAAGTESDPISSFFLEASQPLAKGRNVVNTIIVDFRALDTVAEVAVLAIAGFGVYALLKLRAREKERP